MIFVFESVTRVCLYMCLFSVFCVCLMQVGKETVQTTEDAIMRRDMPPAFIK